MILKKESYLEASYKDRNDILFVHAENLKAVPKQMFINCSNLHGIVCPLVESIEKEGFSGCSSLYELKVPEIKQIGLNSF